MKIHYTMDRGPRKDKGIWIRCNVSNDDRAWNHASCGSGERVGQRVCRPNLQNKDFTIENTKVLWQRLQVCTEERGSRLATNWTQLAKTVCRRKREWDFPFPRTVSLSARFSIITPDQEWKIIHECARTNLAHSDTRLESVSRGSWCRSLDCSKESL